jgi:hypothetical protein
MRALLVAHVAISLVAIAAGLVEVAGWLRGKRWPAVTSVFFWLTLATSLTGFPLPAKQLLPSHVFGFISVIVLAFAYVGLYRKRLAGGWATTYVITAAIAQYLNMFVLVFQSFLKVPALRALAPTQSEPPFAAAQGVLLLAFVAVTVLSVRRVRRPTGGSAFAAAV